MKLICLILGIWCTGEPLPIHFIDHISCGQMPPIGDALVCRDGKWQTDLSAISAMMDRDMARECENGMEERERECVATYGDKADYNCSQWCQPLRKKHGGNLR